MAIYKAYAAPQPGGRLEPFEYDPGPLRAGVRRNRRALLWHLPQRSQHAR